MNFPTLTLAAGLLIASLPWTSPSVAAEHHGLQTRVNAAIDDALGSRRLVGAVVVILRDGRLVYRRAAGFADREAAKKMRTDQLFRLASVSKPIVTVAVLRLVDAGRIHLADPVTAYLPDFHPKLADGSTPLISIERLLTHTAGLSYGFLEAADGPYHRAGVADGLDETQLSLAEELRRIDAAGLAYAPGTRWGYSVAIDVLGAVIERVTNQPLPEAMKDLVLRPAGMIDTGFAPPERSRLATPYADGSPPVRMSDPDVLPFMDLAGIRFSPGRALEARSFPSAGAGMNGTADDVARLLEIVRSGGGALLEQVTAHAMTTNQTGTLPILFGPGWGFGFGGAVLLDPHAANTPQSPGTWSWGGAWGHSWFVDPEQRLVVVGLTNTAVEGMAGKFPTDLRDAVYGRK
jgi:CubicO group peptidase (beta-lactamase class C family)